MRARWGAAGTGGLTRPSHAWGSPLRIAKRWAAATGIHAFARVTARVEARPQVIPFKAGRGGRPAHKRDLQRRTVAKGPLGATGADSPYGRTPTGMEGLEAHITGNSGTLNGLSKVSLRMASHRCRFRYGGDGPGHAAGARLARR
ncbi:hypothetical protein TPA0905_00150 [Streptomyces olivaceus]|nr:hypothetical protein TPA0905_00150 [Streptomyces olivaceus]